MGVEIRRVRVAVSRSWDNEMKVPGVPQQSVQLTAPLPDPMMFVMAAAIMQEYGKFNQPPSPSNTIKRDVELRREVEERSEGAPVDTPLTRSNARVPGNRGLLAPWNRRT